MFVHLILFSFLFPYCLSLKTNNSYGICQKMNLCRKRIESCHPVVIKCQNGSCRYRYFNSSNHPSLSFARWFYDSNRQRCRRYNNQAENFVYFRFLRDCRRLCPIVRRKRTDQIITVYISDNTYNYNDTIYLHLHIDLSPVWMQKLEDWMNVSTRIQNSQAHYFQNYRRRFTNYVDPAYQLMLNNEKKNY